MNALVALAIVAAIAAIGWYGGSAPVIGPVLSIGVPYLAIAVFVGGMAWRVISWGRSPVPFRIPTTCGQGRSLPWIRQSRLDSPSSTPWVVLRVALEAILFRSLARNTRVEIGGGPRLTYASNLWLWAAGLAFHYSLLVVVVRHLALIAHPVPGFVAAVQAVDGFLRVGMPVLYATDVVLACAALFLLGRRLLSPALSYISLVADYFPLLLILGIAATGILMRHFMPVDVAEARRFGVGLVTFAPIQPEGLGPIFHAHVALVSALLVHAPWSKIVHMAGIFMSPTRNLANDSRARRHVNPWNPKVEPRTYAEWEAEFEDKLESAGIPLDGDGK